MTTAKTTTAKRRRPPPAGRLPDPAEVMAAVAVFNRPEHVRMELVPALLYAAARAAERCLAAVERPGTGPGQGPGWREYREHLRGTAWQSEATADGLAAIGGAVREPEPDVRLGDYLRFLARLSDRAEGPG